MRYEWFVAKRYIWSKRRHPFVGVISAVSIIGIAVGVAALITVLAVMNGFDEDLRERIVGTRAHLVIEKDGVFDDYPLLAEKLEKISPIAGVAPYIEGQALFQKGEWAAGVLVRGVDPGAEKAVSKFHKYLVRGTLSDSGNGIVVGSELASRYNLEIGSELLLLSQTAKKPSAFKVEGFFSSGMYDYDANLVFLNLKNAQALFGTPGSVTGLSVRLKNAEAADGVKRKIQMALGYPYSVQSWMDLNRTLFGALKLEKIVMFLILALIILVACLNIAGSLTILVMDKTKDIGVLKALGATPGSLMKIFTIDGFIVGLLGAGTGFLAGTGLCLLLKNYSFIELPKEIYYMDRLPVRMDVSDTLAVFFVALGLSLLSAFYPARTAARLDPVKALRYE